jgi:hypothetical protein
MAGIVHLQNSNQNIVIKATDAFVNTIRKTMQNINFFVTTFFNYIATQLGYNSSTLTFEPNKIIEEIKEETKQQETSKKTNWKTVAVVSATSVLILLAGLTALGSYYFMGKTSIDNNINKKENPKEFCDTLERKFAFDIQSQCSAARNNDDLNIIPRKYLTREYSASDDFSNKHRNSLSLSFNDPDLESDSSLSERKAPIRTFLSFDSLQGKEEVLTTKSTLSTSTAPIGKSNDDLTKERINLYNIISPPNTAERKAPIKQQHTFSSFDSLQGKEEVLITKSTPSASPSASTAPIDKSNDALTNERRKLYNIISPPNTSERNDPTKHTFSISDACTSFDGSPPNDEHSLRLLAGAYNKGLLTRFVRYMKAEIVGMTREQQTASAIAGAAVGLIASSGIKRLQQQPYNLDTGTGAGGIADYLLVKGVEGI